MRTKNSRAAQWRLRIPLLALAMSMPPGVAAEEAALPEIRVTARQDGSDTADAQGSASDAYRHRTATAGPLGRMPLAEMPYSVNVTSGELFTNRGAHTVSEALKTNPTVSTLMESSGYSSMSRVMIRGFTAADQSDLRDGLVDRSFTFVPLENVERIEVLNGFSGFLYGFSALGGSINYIGKQPTVFPYSSVAAGQYGGGVNYLHGDFGGPLDHEGRWRYRVNAYGEDGATYIGGSRQKRGLLSGVLDFNWSADTRWRLDFWKQRLEMRGLQTYFNVNPANGVFVPSASRFDASRQYGQDWTSNEADKSLVGLSVESRLNDTFTARAAGRYGKMWRDYLYVGATLMDNAGTYSLQAIGSTRQHETTRSAYALVDADFHSGPITHKLTFGYTGTMFTYTRGDDVKTALGISHVSAPLEFDNPHFSIGPTNYWTRSNYDNWMIGDRLQFNDAWSALVGVNHAVLRQRSRGTGTALAISNFSQRKFTPSYALMFKPAPAAMLYVSYMEGLANGGVAPSTTANANEMLRPSVSKQYELGAKASIAKMDLTAAIFHIDKVNEYIDPTDNRFKQDGREIHEGIELTATGRIGNRLTLVGGLTAMKAEMRRARNNPPIEGKTPVNVPRRQARLHIEYDIPGVAGLTLTGAANYMGSRPVDAMNTDRFDSATIYDLGARYRTRWLRQLLTVNLHVANLFDKAYWSYYRSGDGLFLGAPRTFALTVKTEW